MCRVKLRAPSMRITVARRTRPQDANSWAPACVKNVLFREQQGPSASQRGYCGVR